MHVAGSFYELWFASRYVHVASIAVLAGGATLAAVVCAFAADADVGFGLAAGLAYERIFWAVLGLTALTGVSNLGLKGDGLLDPSTRWGTVLTVKLSAVLAFLALSFIRTDLILGFAQHRHARHRARVTLAAFYGISAAAMLTVAWMGLGLAHGRY
jgi:hypothetical protein